MINPSDDQEYRRLVGAVQSIGIVGVDLQGAILQWNPGMHRLSGYSEAEARGKPLSLLTPEGTPQSASLAGSLGSFATGGPSALEVLLCRRDGATFRAAVDLSSIKDDAGKPCGFALLVRDLGELPVQAAWQRPSDDSLRLLVDGVLEYGIYMLDVRGHILTWNPGAERIKGYRSSEVLGQHYGRFYTPEDQAANRPLENLRLAVEQGRYEAEAWRVRKDGSRFWASVLITPLRDKNGTLRGFAKITRDLSERKRAEDVLKASEERFRLLVEGTRDYAIFLLDPEGIITSWNGGAERIMGYHADEIIGKSLRVFYSIEEVEQKKLEREIRIAAEQGKVEEEGWRVRRDGSRFWAHNLLTSLRDERGDLRGFSTVTRDATQQKLAQEELRRSEERFRLLVEEVEDYAIFMLDPEGRVETWNQGAQRLKQYDHDEIVGKHFSIFYPPEALASGTPERLLQVALNEGSAKDEGWRVRKDGTRFWADVVITAIKDANGLLTGFAKVTRDMTARRAAEQEIRALNTELQDKVTDLNAFTSTVAHDLRAPLRGMSRAAHILLEDKSAGLDQEGKDYARRIVKASARMDALLVDLLAYSRISRADLKRERVDLKSVITDALHQLEGQIEESKARIRVHPRLPQIVSDQILLGQVFQNLLSNAIKFVPEEVTPEVTVSVEEHSDRIRLQVEDNGIGIEPKLQGRLFQIFERLHPESDYPGTGVGLAIVKRAVDRLGGKAGYEAGSGKGSRFWVELPRQDLGGSTS